MQACLAKLARERRAGGTSGNGGGGGGSAAAAAAAVGGGRGRPAARSRSACRRASGSFRTHFTTPQQTLQQVLEPAADEHHRRPRTRSAASTRRSPTMGVVTPSQVTKGRFLAPAGGTRGARLARPTRPKQTLKVGSKLDLNGTTFTVVGLVSPPLGGQSADVYLPLTQLQTLASQKGLANVVLVRAASGSVGRAGAEGDPDGAPAGAGRELEAGRRHRSAARSSTRRTSRTTSASRSRSSPPSPRSCSPRCSRSRRSASASASSAR